jgi:hypothetical protein
MPSMPRGQQNRSDSTLTQVLSLYLLLLAFFVILFNISKAEQFKTTVVTDSLNSTFASHGRATENPVPLASALGSLIADPAFQQRIGELITAEIPISEVREIKPGTILEARVPIDALFAGDDVAPDRLQFAESLAGALGGAPPGMHYDVEFMVGIAAGTESDADAGHRTLSMVRAGHLAARLVAAGAPPGQVAAGLERGDPKWARLLFYVRGRRISAAAEAEPAVGVVAQ